MSECMIIKLTHENMGEWYYDINEGIKLVTDVEYKTCQRGEKYDTGWCCYASCTMLDGKKFDLHMRKSTFRNFVRDLYSDGKCELIMNHNLQEPVYYLPYEKHPLDSLEGGEK